ncbi:hypothetical protein [Blastococcus mobilis]|uniref:Uncharacterized protein n=1 Tax=Blastococcus mobilis TaxID=1938746 RepID=A0A238VWR7_9ACTN|nr:hypothetical protein [Blastococcus mobilis]SNR38736.1 hypothetical protein SAMN06272737_105117 [Blastococcus mobilis]
MSSNPFDALIREVVRPEADADRTALTVSAGVVAAVNAGPPPTVDVDSAGGTVPTLRYLAGASPQVGDVVWVLSMGGAAMFVLGALA